MQEVAAHLDCTKAALAVITHRAPKSLRAELDRSANGLGRNASNGGAT